MSPASLLIGVILSIIIAALALWRGSLAPSGAFGAIVIGTLIFSGGGLAWSVLLVAFFATSSLLSHYRAQSKAPLADKFQKGFRRDLGQVLANGGWGALLALLYAFFPRPELFVGFVGAMASVNADTWATELGVLSPAPPQLITTGRRVPIGTSGGVTTLGTAVAFAGALLIGVTAYLLSYAGAAILGLGELVAHPTYLIPVAAIAGLLGSLFDSLLGATVQAIFFCEFDRKETESAIHRCGRPARFMRGWRWLDNDGVNFLSSVFGSLIAVMVYLATTL